MKNVIVLGGGGFIGGHLAKKLKEQGNHVRICDLKKHEHFFQNEICDEFIVGDLTDPKVVELVIGEGVDEVYQLAADMGGAMYIFTGQHDADVMYNSATINLNVVRECVKKKVGKVFYSSSACMYPEHNQLDPENPNPQIQILNMDGKNCSPKDYIWLTKKTMVSTLKLQDSIISTDHKEHGMGEEKRLLRQCVEKLLKQKMVMRLKFGGMVIKPVHFYLLMNVLGQF